MPAKRTPRSPWPIVMILVGLVLIVGAGLWYLSPGFSNAPEEPPNITVEADPANIPRASLADSKEAFDAGTAVFVDVRDASAYAQSHIPGALSIPLNELPSRMGELEPSEWIITY